jgi:transketolase
MSETLKKVPPRDGYGKALLKLCESRDDVVVLDADVAKSTRTNWVEEKFADKFINMGISEQDMAGTAAGLALGGMIPFISTYGVFLSGRAWDQIRTTICYNELNVKFGGAHAGISVGPDGATHQAIEDMAITRVLPGMTLIAPCDALEVEKATIAAADYPGPVYLRFGREAIPVITDEDSPFEIGRAITLRQGGDVAIFACGALVREALLAADALEAEGIKAQVLNMHTIKPIDEAAIINAVENCGCAVTAEEHQIIGGLGGAVAEVLAKNLPAPVEMIGIYDSFGESGDPDELMQAYGLTSKEIYAAAKKALARKK